MEDLAKVMDTPDGYRIRVREYELIYPLLQSSADSTQFAPDHVVSAMWAKPLLDLAAAGKIPAPHDDTSRLNSCQADALMIAGRYDHVADYRVSMTLAAHYPNHVLLLLNDDHQMHSLLGANEELRNRLFQGWTEGFGSEAFKTAYAAIAPLRWRESLEALAPEK